MTAKIKTRPNITILSGVALSGKAGLLVVEVVLDVQEDKIVCVVADFWVSRPSALSAHESMYRVLVLWGVLAMRGVFCGCGMGGGV